MSASCSGQGDQRVQQLEAANAALLHRQEELQRKAQMLQKLLDASLLAPAPLASSVTLQV